jgi:hypothetical protein
MKPWILYACIPTTSAAQQAVDPFSGGVKDCSGVGFLRRLTLCSSKGVVEFVVPIGSRSDGNAEIDPS